MHIEGWTGALRACALGAAVITAGCSVIVDGAIRDRDAGDDGAARADASTVMTCEGAADGTACGTDRVCVAEVCALSRCGDGAVDSARDEQCDDGNSVAGDGCEPTTCRFTCEVDGDCDDGESCNGEETCSPTTHTCIAGVVLADATECMLGVTPMLDGGVPDAGLLDGGVEDPSIGQCRAGTCVAQGCGNGVLGGDEACDDGNDVDGDGCDVDCTLSCTEDADCQNATVCDGIERCDLATHTCLPGEAPDCADTENVANGRGEWGPDCTVDTCDDAMGCVSTLRDQDGDGYPPASYTIEGTTYSCLGTAANDCNDVDESVYPGAEEMCDGRDNNCMGGIDETAPTWYADCDGDGFARVGATTFTGCTPPAATGCPNEANAGWTATRPVSGMIGSYDCNDANPNVRPTQATFSPNAIPAPGSGYDWNCDGRSEQQVPNPPPCTGWCPVFYCQRMGTRCVGSDYGWEDGTAPACGVSEAFGYCGSTGPLTCGKVVAQRRQACR